MKPLRGEEFGFQYRHRVVNKWRLSGAPRNVNTHVVLISERRPISGRWAVDRRTASGRELKLSKDGRVNTCATDACIDESLSRNGAGNLLTCRLECMPPSLAHSDEDTKKQVSIRCYLLSEVWHGTNREMN
jgi:hypothetical protein